MPDYFLSDVHLRLDRPDRGQRLAAFVNALQTNDWLYIVGDLCDFWLASRQRSEDLSSCMGLESLRRFRDRGGKLSLLFGNHDLWLGSIYEAFLGVNVQREPMILDSHGRRLLLMHGHRIGSTARWKTFMETRAFLNAFSALPSALAHSLERALDQRNDRVRAEADRRHLAIYREKALGLESEIEILVTGHVHQPIDERVGAARLIVLGDWLEGSSYLRIDKDDATLVVQR